MGATGVIRGAVVILTVLVAAAGLAAAKPDGPGNPGAADAHHGAPPGKERAGAASSVDAAHGPGRADGPGKGQAHEAPGKAKKMDPSAAPPLEPAPAGGDSAGHPAPEPPPQEAPAMPDTPPPVDLPEAVPGAAAPPPDGPDPGQAPPQPPDAAPDEPSPDPAAEPVADVAGSPPAGAGASAPAATSASPHLDVDLTGGPLASSWTSSLGGLFQATQQAADEPEMVGPELPAAAGGPPVAAFDGGPSTPAGNAARGWVPLLSVQVPAGATGWLVGALGVGVAAGLASATLTVRALLRRTPAPQRAAAPGPASPSGPEVATRPPSLADLVLRVRAAPYDGEAHYRLGIGLMACGQEAVALRHLERSFTLYPQGVLELLTRPDLAPVRDHERVRTILRRFHRDQQRRLWAGYA